MAVSLAEPERNDGGIAYGAYVSHEGEKPINIVWKLEQPIPAKFLKKTNKLAVG